MKTSNITSITKYTLAGLLSLGYTIVAQGGPVFHNQAVNPVQNVPAVAGFQTEGDDMTGMLVTVFFSDGTSDTDVWSPTVIGSGEAGGANWNLSVSGDTFVAPWTLSYTGGNGLLTGFSIDGFGVQGPGDVGTMFDRTLDRLGGLFGTPGSARGRDLEEVAALPFAVHARYVGAVDALSDSDPAYEDEFRWLNVRFFERGGTAIDDEFLTAQPEPVGLDGDTLQVFEFRQDTNNVVVPEPAAVGLAMVALIGLFAAIPRCRSRS
jgi:hypothetical protein